MTHCKFCGRPAHLWGGKSCDVCDRDGNGINDKDEPVGFSPIKQDSVFHIEEKGFVISSPIKLPVRARLRLLKEKGFEIVGNIQHVILIPKVFLAFLELKKGIARQRKLKSRRPTTFAQLETFKRQEDQRFGELAERDFKGLPYTIR